MRRISFLVLLFVSTLLPAWAQVSPKEQAKVFVGLRASVKAAANYQFRVYSENTGETDPLATTTYTNQGGLTTAVVSANAFVKLIPGQLYHLVVTSTSWASADFQFNVPPGYALRLSQTGEARSTRQTYLADAPSGGNGTTTFDLEIVPQDGAAGLRAGFSTVPSIGEVLWAIGVGTTQSGRYAGVLRWRQSGITQDLLDPLSLIYADPVDNDVSVGRAGDGSISSITTWAVCIEVAKDSAPSVGYTITARPPWEDSTVFRSYHVYNPDSTWQNRVRIDVTSYDGDTTRYDQWTLSKSGNVTQLLQQDGSLTNGLRRVETLSRAATASTTDTDSSDTFTADDREEIVSLYDGSATTPTMRTRRVYRTLYKTKPQEREELIREISDPGSYFNAAGAAQTQTSPLAWVTRYTYFETDTASGSFTKLKSVTRPDGSWVAYKYFGDATSDSADAARWGQLSRVYQPWQDSSGVTASNASDSNCQATLLDYAVSRTGGVWCELSAGSETKTIGTTTAKRTISYSFWTNSSNQVMPGVTISGQPMRTETIQDYSASGAYLTTTKKVFHTTANALVAGRVWSQLNPDGTKMSVIFAQSGYNWVERQISGTDTSPIGMASATHLTQYFSSGTDLDPIWVVPSKSVARSLSHDASGHIVGDTTETVFLSSGVYSMVAATWITRVYSDEGFLREEYNQKGEGSDKHYANGQLRDQTDKLDGTSVSFTYDDLMRPLHKIVAGVSAASPYAAQSAIDTAYTYDAANHELTSTTSAGGLTTSVTSKLYNRAGMLYQITENGLVTDIAYTDGGRTVTTTLPGASGNRPTKVETRYLDGSVKSITGTAVVGQYITRAPAVGVSGIADGSLITISYTLRASDVSAPTSAPRWSKTITDWAGRTMKEEKPAPTGTFAKVYSYNSLGQLYKTTEPNLADTLTTYNAFGEPELTGLDLNANGSLDLASLDRISKKTTGFEARWEQFVGYTSGKRTSSYVYNQDNNSTAASLGDVQETFTLPTSGLYVDQKISTDLFGNVTTQSRVKVATGAGSPLLKTVTDLSDSTTDEVTISRNGVVQSKQTAQGLTTTYVYDALRRVVEQVDPRYGAGHPLKTAYYTNVSAAAGTYAIYSSNAAANGQVAWRKDAAGNQTTYTYSADDGRLVTETNALSKATYTAYNLRGQVIRQWGPATYPVEYEYNDYGERTKMRTFRSTSTDYTTATWGTGTYPSTTGDLTTWGFDPATGLLLTKTDAANKTVTYTYNVRGQLATRIWARAITTTYRYFGDGSGTTGEPKTAEQRAIEYSDGTPTIAYAYNRMGQMKSVTQGVSTNTLLSLLERCLCGKITRETFDPTFFGNQILTRKLDTTGTGTKGRTVGYQLGVTGSYALNGDYTYGYDTFGRFNSLQAVNESITYSYGRTANSNLIASINDSVSGYAQLFTYEPYRDHVATIEGKFGARTLAGVAYGVDELGRRSTAQHYGEIFGRYPGLGHHTAWGYNDRSEVTGEQTWAGQILTDTSMPLGGRNYGYGYDPIGNRTTTTLDGATTSTYTPNALNQYSSRTVAGSVPVAGLAPASETVTVKSGGVDQGTVSRLSNYFYKSVSASNSSAPAWLSLEVSTATGGTTSRTAFVPPATETFTHDDDGNLTGDGRWTYTWDAENRLTSMETKSAAYGVGAPRQVLMFKYDYLGRRIRKTVANWSGSAYVIAVDRKFIYDGWNLIAEYDALTTFTLARTFVWGLDISRTLEDAGGVHGLLMINDYGTSQNYQTVYDGNGNILGLVQRSTGALVAQYEYSPYGELIRSSGSYANSNPFRFSTKYTDNETGLVYYGRRYYDPKTGRWLGRDPKEELGGLHLYAFVRNNPANRWDYLGMSECGNDEDHSGYAGDDGGGLEEWLDGNAAQDFDDFIAGLDQDDTATEPSGDTSNTPGGTTVTVTTVQNTPGQLPQVVGSTSSSTDLTFGSSFGSTNTSLPGSNTITTGQDSQYGLSTSTPFQGPLSLGTSASLQSPASVPTFSSTYTPIYNPAPATNSSQSNYTSGVSSYSGFTPSLFSPGLVSKSGTNERFFAGGYVNYKKYNDPASFEAAALDWLQTKPALSQKAWERIMDYFDPANPVLRNFTKADCK